MTSTIIKPGQVWVGAYRVERLHSKSPVAESWLARRTATREEVILTCSRLDQPKSGPSLRAGFKANAARLTAADVDWVPRVLAADVTNGVYWVVREHFTDAVPLWDFLRTETELPADVAAFRRQFFLIPRSAYTVLVLLVGAMIAHQLDSYSAAGIHHGGLDAMRTVALRDGKVPVVLETGYRSLFGEDHFPVTPETEEFVAPEIPYIDHPDEQSDIYSLGVILRMISAFGIAHARVEPNVIIRRACEGLTRHPRSERIKTLSEVYDLFNGMHEQASPKAADLEGSGNPLPPDDTSEQLPTPRSGERGLANEDPSDTDPGSSPFVEEESVSESEPKQRTSSEAPDEPTTPEMELRLERVTVLVPHPVANDTAAAILSAGTAIAPPPAPTANVDRSLPRRRTETAPARHPLWVIAAYSAVLMGFVALRTVPLLGGRVADTPSAIQNARRPVALPDKRDGDRTSEPYRSGYSAARRIVDRGERGRQYSATRGGPEWTAAFDIVTPSRKLTNE